MATSYCRLSITGLALAVWLIARPYSGIWHDSEFYALQALLHLYPSVFSRDLFFLYGSQDQYSLFSHLHAAAIAIGGLNRGTMVLQGLGLVLWFVAAWAMTRILPGKLAAVALLLMASVDSGYGSHGVFSYGERFLTARLYAEALSLAGLAAWLAGRKALGGLAFAAACAMHPLMALPAMMIGLGVLLQTRVWLGLVGAGVLLALGLGVMGVPPFTGLLQPMDALWFEMAVARSPFVFLHTWEWRGFSRALFVVVVTATAWRILAGAELRRLAWVTGVCMLGAFAMAYVGASLLKLPLIAGLQLTRVMWIGQVITLILLVAMIWESRRGNVWNRMLVLGLALGVFLDADTQGGYALLVLAVFWLGKHRVPDYKPPVWLWLLIGLVPLQIMLWELLGMSTGPVWEDVLAEPAFWRMIFSSSATALVMAVGAYWLLGKEPLSKPLEWAGATVAVALLGLAIVTWNELSPQLNYDSPEYRAAIAPVQALVPQHAIVYWVEEPEKAWFWLGRANYLSFRQGAGAVFSRGTAVEILRRAPFARPASLEDAKQSRGKPTQEKFTQSKSRSVLGQVCRDPILDYVIGRRLSEPGMVHFKNPRTGVGYWVYDCEVIRAENATESTINAVDVQERVKKHL